MLVVLIGVVILSTTLIIVGSLKPKCRLWATICGVAPLIYVAAFFVWGALIYFRIIPLDLSNAVLGGMSFFLPPLMPVLLFLIVAIVRHKS